MNRTEASHLGILFFVLSGMAVFVASRQVRADESPAKPMVIKARTLHVGNGEVIQGGMIVIADGHIQSVGANLTVPAAAHEIEIPGGSITPGLIDANVEIDSSGTVPVDSRDAAEVVRDLFESHEGHRHEAGVDCCGSACPLSFTHVDGARCTVCGFPDKPPPFAVGTRMSRFAAESSSEIVPHTRVIDSVNLRSPDFDRLLQGGVTTIFVAPDPSAVISSQGAVVRTGGPLAERIVRQADAVMAGMGVEPSRRGWSNRRPWRESVSFYSRRPTTRMGVAWVFRKALHDTRRHLDGLPISGADAPSEPAMKVLAKVLSGEVPLRIQARMQHDILTALRLAEEFGLRFTLVEGTEAHRCLAELSATQTPVVYGPIYIQPPGFRGSTGEVDQAKLHTFSALLDARIKTALSADELRDEDGLARQAMYAHRLGVPMTEVTKSVTSTPAALLGLDEQIGTLATGKRADIVVWSGEPFEGTSQPLVVLIGGEVVLDKRRG